MLAKKYPEKGLLMFYPVLVITKTTLKPITFFFKRIIKQDDGSSIKSVSELKEAIDEISQFDHITTSEQKLLQKSLILDETPVKNKMIPIADMVSITPYSTEKTILSIIKESKFTRLPIVKNNKIIGVLNTKTLLIDLQSSTKADFKQLVSNNTFEIKEIKWTDSLSEAFTELRNARRHMASVVNSKNKTVGFITVEDIVESIVGQMYDETEYEKDGIFKISDSAYQLDSSANAYIFFNEYLNKKPPAIIKKTTTFKQFVSEIATDKNQEQIIYKNFIIWVKKDKIKKEVIFEVDTIQNEK